MAASPPQSLWRNHDYLLLWSGQTVSAIGSQFSGFMIPLLVLVLTGSGAQAGLIGAAGSLPYLVLSLPAGALVDRWNRKAVMIACDAGRALNIVSVAVALGIGRLSIAQLYLVSVVEGILFVFFTIAETASLTRVVSAEQLPDAVARQETTWGLSALIGPAGAGALYQAVSAAVPFVVDGLSYAVSALSLSAIQTRFQEERLPARASLRAEIREALQWLWRQRLLRFLTMVTAAGDCLFAPIGLIPMVIARQQMHASPAAIGFIFTLAAVGGIVGSILAGPFQRRVRFASAMTGSSWLLAVLYPLLALAPSPLALGLVRTGISAVVSMSNPVRLSYPLRLIPDALQGRVNSLTTLLAYGSLPVGQALAGIGLQTIGSTATILVISGCLAALAAAVTVNGEIRTAR
jgi:MFS family permease